MLADELLLLKCWTASRAIDKWGAVTGDLCPVEAECERIRHAWTRAAFSAATDERLKRYFQHQLLELTEICGYIEQTDLCLSSCALSLIDHLRFYHHPYFDNTVRAPGSYRCRFGERIRGQVRELTERLNAAALDPELKDCLLTFLEAITSDCTFQFLDYFGNWVSELSGIALTGPRLQETLELLNFNDLFYYRYRQEALAGYAAPEAEKIAHLHTERSRLMALPLTDGLARNPRWPSLSSMLCGWMAEEIAFLSEMHKMTANEAFSAQPEKYPLNLSVAHLACFLKVFSIADLTNNRNLSRLFNFVADHFSSKRQENISARSLSKEYYGTTQVTAAKVLGMLERMIQDINRLYFP